MAVTIWPTHRSFRSVRTGLAWWCAISLVFGQGVLLAQDAAKTPPAPPPAGATAPAAAPGTPAAPETEEPKIPPDQLDALVAPIALYPDPLLAQTLVASTYPLEIIQLQQWMAKNKDLKDKALADAVAKQPWDPSIQSMAATPEVVKRLAEDIQWTTDLGNAFLAQQADVMDAVQRMRKKAKDNGALESNEQQKVETQVVEEKTVIVVQSANPEVIYVPSYSPVVRLRPAGLSVSADLLSPVHRGSGVRGVRLRRDDGRSDLGRFVLRLRVGRQQRQHQHQQQFQPTTTSTRGGGGGNWQHNPSHRGGTPYGNKATANKYGNSARSGNQKASASNRAAGGGSPSASNRAGGGSPSASNKAAGGGSPGASNGGAAAARRARATGGGRIGSAGSKNNIGSRNVPSSSASRSGGGFGGSGGYSGSSARSSSSRGASSMGSRGGGGRGGGGRR